MKLSRVGVDLSKNVFQAHGVNRQEKTVWRQQLKRNQWLKAVESMLEPGGEVGMESCAGAHHRIRTGLVTERTAKANQIRGLVAEYGLVAPRELLHLRRAIPLWLEDAENSLSLRFRALLNGLRDDLKMLDDRVRELEWEIEAIAQADEVTRRLQQLRGVGPIIATALVASVGDARQFANGRQMAASLGLTPVQSSTGGKERLLGISKRGDSHLRALLIHGARSVLHNAKNKDDRLSLWVKQLAQRSHPNKAAVALANKTACIAWAMLRHGTDYQPERAAA